MLKDLMAMYADGKFTNGVFEKVAQDIIEKRYEEEKIEQLELEKKAGILAKIQNLMGQKGGAALVGMGVLGAGTAAAVGVDAISGSLKNYRQGIAQDIVFKNLIAANPELNTAKAMRNFISLKKVAPDMAADPAMAEGFINRLDSFDVLDMAPIAAAAQIQKNLSDIASRSQGRYGVDDAAKSIIESALILS